MGGGVGGLVMLGFLCCCIWGFLCDFCLLCVNLAFVCEIWVVKLFFGGGRGVWYVVCRCNCCEVLKHEMRWL